MNDMTRIPAPTALAIAGGVIPFDHLERMAAAIAKSGLFGMKTPDQALALMLISQAEGQHPATITQDYDIIQGRAARKTNSVLARFQAAGGSVEWHELTDKKADATFTPPARAGKPLRITWTIEQAKAAKLAGKDNWTTYPRAMLRARCIAEGVRAVYPAAIGGMMVSEEAQDVEPIEKDVTAQGSHETARKAPEKPAYGAADFEKNLPKWRDLIDKGRKTADDIIATVESKATLTDEQKTVIRDQGERAAEQDVAAMVEKAAEGEISIADLCKHLKVEKLEGLTKAQLAAAYAFIADPAGSAQ